MVPSESTAPHTDPRLTSAQWSEYTPGSCSTSSVVHERVAVPYSLDSCFNQQNCRKASRSHADDSAAYVGTVGGHVIILPGSLGHCLIAEVML